MADITVRKVPLSLRAVEADLEADYKRFTRTKPLRFNLAYAEGFEAMLPPGVQALLDRYSALAN